MYMFLTTPEPGNPRLPRKGLAAAMRERLKDPPPALASLVEQITDDAEVVYKPLETLFLKGDWHKGRVVLLGDAVHATTPHLGQGAGMAIEDSIVLAEELARAVDPGQAFNAYRQRRFERCRYIVEASLSVCHSQLGKGPNVDHGQVTREMFGIVAAPL
jgi:2-polyprenyl-6-methoxyphenol hydroxylase-like FAD-dependent oxidoreductase